MVRGMSLKRRNADSSEGIEPELLIMMTCFKEGTTGDVDDNDSDGTICFNKGI